MFGMLIVCLGLNMCTTMYISRYLISIEQGEHDGHEEHDEHENKLEVVFILMKTWITINSFALTVMAIFICHVMIVMFEMSHKID